MCFVVFVHLFHVSSTTKHGKKNFAFYVCVKAHDTFRWKRTKFELYVIFRLFVIFCKNKFRCTICCFNGDTDVWQQRLRRPMCGNTLSSTGICTPSPPWTYGLAYDVADGAALHRAMWTYSRDGHMEAWRADVAWTQWSMWSSGGAHAVAGGPRAGVPSILNDE
jgi:hypothetical protein